MAELGKRTILIADSSDQTRGQIAEWLRQAGFAVVEASSGKETVARAAQRPDVIILDANLPDRSGFEVAYHLKQDPATGTVPVIHLASAFTTGEWRAQGLEAGADSFLNQPIERSELIATVRAALRVRQAEEEVRTAAEEWEATFDAITDAVCIVDATGALLRCNDAADDLLGELQSGRHGSLLQEMLPPPEESPNVVAAAVETQEPRRYETLVADRWFSVRIDPVPPREATPPTAVAVISDITERRAAEEERTRLLSRAEAARKEAEISRMEAEAARSEAEAASRAKSEFLAVMSHELRTPLNAIDGYAELLEFGVRGPITDAQRDDIRRIRRSQKHLLALINDVLNFVRLEAGTVRYNVHSFRLADAIHDVEDVTAPQLRAKDLRYVRRVCGEDVRIRADRDKLEQILVNLMTNAIKFTDSGGEITLECARNGALVAVMVRDTGRGIPPDKLSAIFEPFVQVARSSGAPGEGVGLGLAISRDLSRAMGGDLVAESTLGKGSTFTLTLPVGTAN